MVEDPRFSRAIVNAVYFGMTGQRALEEPTDPTAIDYVAQIRAFEVQDYVFKNVASTFVDSGYDLRTLIIELVETPYFRAKNVEPVDETRALELADLGAVHLVTPEQLHRRIVEATGYGWKEGNGTLLPLARPYHLMYGGIDSDIVTQRLPELNGVMVNVAERMANEMACLAAGQDFARPAGDRLLFPEVEVADLPGVDDADIRANIVHLHARLLGETLAPDDPEIERTYELFVDVQGDGISGIAAAEYSPTLIMPCRATDDPNTGDPLAEQIVEDPDYTIRAWTAVVAAMLGDFRFLYE
jgi:hypothetical protein